MMIKWFLKQRELAKEEARKEILREKNRCQHRVVADCDGYPQCMKQKGHKGLHYAEFDLVQSKYWKTGEVEYSRVDVKP